MIKQLIYALKSGCIKSCLQNTIELQVGEQVFLVLDRDQIPALPTNVIATVTNVQIGTTATPYSRQYTFDYDDATIVAAGVTFLEACTIKSVPVCVSCCDLLDARVDILETSNTTLVTRVTTAEADINALEAKDVILQAADTALAGRVTTAEADINALEAKDIALQAADAALAGRVTVAEADIDALQAKDLVLQAADTALAGRVATLEAKPATTLTNSAAPFGWNQSTQTGNIPQSSTVIDNGNGTFSFNNGTGAAPVTIPTGAAAAGISTDADNTLVLGTDGKAKSVRRFIANTVYVDPLYGSDATGAREREDLPYRTSAAAIAAAINGDHVVYRPDATGTVGDIVVNGKTLVIDTSAVRKGGSLTLTNSSQSVVLGATDFGIVSIVGGNSKSVSVGTVGHLFLQNLTFSNVTAENVVGTTSKYSGLRINNCQSCKVHVDGEVIAPLTNTESPNVSFAVEVSDSLNLTVLCAADIYNASEVVTPYAVSINNSNCNIYSERDIYSKNGHVIACVGGIYNQKVQARAVYSSATFAATQGVIIVNTGRLTVQADRISNESSISNASLFSASYGAVLNIDCPKILKINTTPAMDSLNGGDIVFLRAVYFASSFSNNFASAGGAGLRVFCPSRFATNMTSPTPVTSGPVTFPDFTYVPNVSIPTI